MRRMGVREAVWVSYKPQGVEHCTVIEGNSGWALEGTLVRHFREGSAMVHYKIETDPGWRTKSLSVEQILNGKRRFLDVEVKGQRWYKGGKELVALKGCTDIDLTASPITNTLPIRRSRLSVGASMELKVAWVSFPSLKITPLHQEYRRLGRNRYRYRGASGFTAVLEVDDFGLVKRYGHLWAAVVA